MRPGLQSVNTTGASQGAASLGDILARTAELQPPAIRVRSARSKNRASAWAYDLAKWREYRLAMARSEDEKGQIERQYEELMGRGPDFAHYHAKSDYAPPTKNSLSKAQKQALLSAFDQVRAWLYRNSRKAHGQGVSRLYREILSVILSFAVKFGEAYPSQQTIARLACCSQRTVANALGWLKLWGFLDWTRRLKRVTSIFGSRAKQTSNAYIVSAESLSAIGAAIFFRAPSRNNSTPSQFQRLLRNLRAFKDAT